jgi:hypothetical protein
MRVLGIDVLPADEKSVAATYRLSPGARALLVRAHGHPLGYVLLRAVRDSLDAFIAGRELVSMDLARVLLLSTIDGEESIAYSLTARGREVARVVASS